eukprot:gene26032-biopygen17913
MSRGGCSRPEL